MRPVYVYLINRTSHLFTRIEQMMGLKEIEKTEKKI